MVLFPLASSHLCAEDIEGKLIFPDGESLPGLPNGVSKEGFLQWESPLFLKDAAPFRTMALDTIRLASKAPNNDNIATQATITFQDRIDDIYDVMKGELLEFNDESVKLRTWYAGDLILKRTMLHTIEVSTSPPAIINGPGQLTDWQMIDSDNAWRIEGKKLISSERGSIAQEFLDLPNQVKLEFNLEADSSPYLRLNFFSNSGEDLIPRTGYSVTIHRGSMQFLKRVDNRSIPLRMEQFGRRHDFQQGEPSQIELYIDREEGTFSLYIDGDSVSSATDPEPLMEDNWWHISTLHAREQSLSNFAIRAWDGELPERKDYLDFRQELPVLGEEIELHNGDTIIGKATSIKDGKLKIETEYVPVAVPIERLQSFQVTSEEAREEPRLYNEDVRAHFPHGGHVTLKLINISNTTITGFSQVFGEATFDLRAFTHIDFNVYDPEFRARRGLPF